MTPARLVTAVWFLAAFALSRSGFFERFSSATLFGIGSLISATGFAVVFFGFKSFREYTRSRSLKQLTLLQMARFYGAFALYKGSQGLLPAVFALPTGIGDVALALTAPYVAARMVSSSGSASTGFYAWHLTGLAHLGVAAALAVLTSPTPFGVLAGDITSQPLTQFPMSLAPVFFGPFVLNGHLSALAAARSRHGKRQ